MTFPSLCSSRGWGQAVPLGRMGAGRQAYHPQLGKSNSKEGASGRSQGWRAQDADSGVWEGLRHDWDLVMGAQIRRWVDRAGGQHVLLYVWEERWPQVSKVCLWLTPTSWAD